MQKIFFSLIYPTNSCCRGQICQHKKKILLCPTISFELICHLFQKAARRIALASCGPLWFSSGGEGGRSSQAKAAAKENSHNNDEFKHLFKVRFTVSVCPASTVAATPLEERASENTPPTKSLSCITETSKSPCIIKYQLANKVLKSSDNKYQGSQEVLKQQCSFLRLLRVWGQIWLCWRREREEHKNCDFTLHIWKAIFVLSASPARREWEPTKATAAFYVLLHKFNIAHKKMIWTKRQQDFPYSADR